MTLGKAKPSAGLQVMIKRWKSGESVEGISEEYEGGEFEPMVIEVVSSQIQGD